MFNVPEAADTLAFRGGTALYKLYLSPPARYSEDIDLVQVVAGPIGGVLDAVRARLDPWLGSPRCTLKEGRAVLLYRMQSEGPTPLPLRLKIEINSREHFRACPERNVSHRGLLWRFVARRQVPGIAALFRGSGNAATGRHWGPNATFISGQALGVFDLIERQYDLRSRWYSGDATIKTYKLDELLGTKLRARYQRKKSRDLFDLWTAHRAAGNDPERIVTCFLRCLEEGGLRVSRAEFEANLAAKLADPMFTRDIEPLLAPRAELDLEQAGRYAREELLVRLPGEPWKGGEA